MPSREYYRRQSELCLRLALLHDNAQMTYRLVELAKDLLAKAEAAADTGRDQPLLPSHLMAACGVDRD